MPHFALLFALELRGGIRRAALGERREMDPSKQFLRIPQAINIYIGEGAIWPTRLLSATPGPAMEN